jgi:hypothetical protein
MSGVKNLLPSSNDLPITKTVEALMDGTENLDEFKTFDPKVAKGALVSDMKKTGRSSSQQKAATFQDSIVFVIGGGNYVEFQNLMEFSGVTIILMK